jgi:hypothetical protein
MGDNAACFTCCDPKAECTHNGREVSTDIGRGEEEKKEWERRKFALP